MSFLGRLFGTDTAMQKTLDAGISAIDKVVYTEQERHEMRAQLLVIIGDYMQKTSGQDLARRVIALALVIQYIFMLNIAIFFAIFSTGERADYMLNLLAETMQNPLNIILGFYFLTQAITQYKKAGNNNVK